MSSNTDEIKQSTSGDSIGEATGNARKSLDLMRSVPNGGGAVEEGEQKAPALAQASSGGGAAAPVAAAGTIGTRHTSSYEDRMRAKLREADEHQASHLTRASRAGNDTSYTASVQSRTGGGVTSSRRANRFWNKVNNSTVGTDDGDDASTAVSSVRDPGGNSPKNDSVHEPPPDDDDEEEVRAGYGFHGDNGIATVNSGGDEVRAEMGLRPGEVDDVASGIAPPAPRGDLQAKEGYIVVGSRSGSGAGGPPVIAGGMPPPSPEMVRKNSMQSTASDKMSVGGVPGAHSVTATTGHNGHVGHGSVSEDGFGNEIYYDENNTPMVVAQAVNAVSERDVGGSGVVGQQDSFNENGARPTQASVSRSGTRNVSFGTEDAERGGGMGSLTSTSRSGEGGDRRASSRVLGVAVATRDTFKDHLFRSRKTQCGLAALLVVVVALAVGLGVALTQGGGSGSGNTAGDEDGGYPGGTIDEGFWQQDPPTIDGTSEQGDFGATVSLNADGTRLAVGAPGVWDADGSDFLRRGLVEVHRRNSDGEWVLLGEPILPTARDSNSDILIPSMGVRNLIKVVISGDGYTVAVGSSFHDAEDGKNLGQVEVFRLSDSTNQWIPMGEPIVGEHENDYLGASVDLSEDGGTLAVGIPGHTDEVNSVENTGAARMFFFNNGKWDKLGSADAVGTAEDEMLGGSVSLSSDGRKVAVGSSATQDGSNTKVAKVFKFVGGDWREVGDGVEGGEGLYDTAYDAKLSADGTRLVVSNHYIGENGPSIQSGEANNDLFVAAFEYDEDADLWEIIGTNLHSSSVGDKSGYFITLSDDGNVVGMGDPGRSISSGRIAGHAHIYVYDPEGGEDGGGEYRQVGPNIDGEAAGDMFGYEVALAGDGTSYAIGAPSSRGNGFEHGRVQVYDVPQ